MEEIKAYKTSDGTVFEDKKDAETRQAEIDFIEWYEDNKLYDNYDGSYCDAKDLVEWIIENRDMVEKILNSSIKLDGYFR